MRLIELSNETLFLAAEQVKHCLDHPFQVTTRENKNGVLSVLFFGKPAVRLGLNRQGLFVELLSSSDDAETSNERYGLPAKLMSTGYIRYTLFTLHDIERIREPLNDAWRDAARSLEKFGCCHLHVACSDAKRCLYEEDPGEHGAWCWGCMYHWNLLDGRIFYGKNAMTPQGDKPESNYAVIDVELANMREKGSICSIGIVWVRENQIIDRFYSLVNPCCRFDSICTNVHHITQQSVCSAPTFAQVRTELAPRLKDMPLVAYHAETDIYAIEKALFDAKIDDHGLRYADALKIAKTLLPDLPSYKLANVAEHLGVSLDDAHHALADAQATAGVMIALQSARGISCLEALLLLCDLPMQNSRFNSYEPADDVRRANSASGRRETAPAVELPHGKSSYFNGKNVLFTGNLSCTTRECAQKAVAQMGGIIKSAPSKKLNVLIVGTYDAATLSPGARIGNKLRMVLDLKSQGQEIDILNEAEFLEILSRNP